ncbi:hypothetical protein MLD38_034400 [Melastoma candidum]|uniref:Uncharacterized protein n=1 Tax=Melastoma candidum TaxID=119954 RepID=A0ACB9MBW3_9MYRT|nr:hypothetical protein MLD38_034400 [Melastoma candidum]
MIREMMWHEMLHYHPEVVVDGNIESSFVTVINVRKEGYQRLDALVMLYAYGLATSRRTVIVSEAVIMLLWLSF